MKHIKIFETWLNDEDFSGEEHAVDFGAWILSQLLNGNLITNPNIEDKRWLYKNKPCFTEDIYKEYQNDGGLYTNYISKEG